MTVASIPTIHAELHGELQVRFYCPHCRQFHYHGRGDGHRVAHCRATHSPYLKTGYILLTVPAAEGDHDNH